MRKVQFATCLIWNLLRGRCRFDEKCLDESLSTKLERGENRDGENAIRSFQIDTAIPLFVNCIAPRDGDRKFRLRSFFRWKNHGNQVVDATVREISRAWLSFTAFVDPVVIIKAVSCYTESKARYRCSIVVCGGCSVDRSRKLRLIEKLRTTCPINLAWISRRLAFFFFFLFF